jgi:hypothetical protein
MGRHSTSGAQPEGQVGAPRLARWAQRVAFALTGGVTTALAVAWAGNTWAAAAGAGVAAGVVVLGAAWLASTVPPPAPVGHGEHSADEATSAVTDATSPADAAGHPAGRDPVQ